MFSILANKRLLDYDEVMQHRFFVGFLSSEPVETSFLKQLNYQGKTYVGSYVSIPSPSIGDVRLLAQKIKQELQIESEHSIILPQIFLG